MRYERPGAPCGSTKKWLTQCWHGPPVQGLRKMTRIGEEINTHDQNTLSVNAILLRFSSVAAFAIGCVLAITAAVADMRVAKEREQSVLERQAIIVEREFSERISMYRNLLRIGEGLMAHDPDMTPAEWNVFIEKLDLVQSYPGIERISIVKYVSTLQKVAFIQRQKTLIPSFDIVPVGDRPNYLVTTRVTNLVTSSDIIGLDMGINRGLRYTAETARDTGDAT